MKTLEKVSDFVGKYMAAIVIVVAAGGPAVPAYWGAHRPFSWKARRGSSHGCPALPCTNRQLSAAFLPGTLSRHSRNLLGDMEYTPLQRQSQ